MKDEPAEGIRFASPWGRGHWADESKGKRWVAKTYTSQICGAAMPATNPRDPPHAGVRVGDTFATD